MARPNETILVREQNDLHEKETLERENQVLQRHNQELQNKVKNLEQENSRSGRQESSKLIESLNREKEICKDLIGELIDSETRKKLIQRYYDFGNGASAGWTTPESTG